MMMLEPELIVGEVVPKVIEGKQRRKDEVVIKTNEQLCSHNFSIATYSTRGNYGYRQFIQEIT
jgi:hypothetical protein